MQVLAGSLVADKDAQRIQIAASARLDQAPRPTPFLTDSNKRGALAQTNRAELHAPPAKRNNGPRNYA